ncbi:Nif3-like dinuclear metal center hexameric protein [Staphylococcus chromogenes]|nr:Nif3-like dinuclear metal center hexameric protein [Staphylococcus chromogenes]
MTTVADIRGCMERAYPPHLAEPWDKVGLICGDPSDEVSKVVFALDCTQEVAQRAVDLGAQMLIVHHPLLLRGVTSVAADTPKGKVIHTLLRGGVALFAAHTNADSARPGVNDKLAELVGITAGRPIVPKPIEGRDKWGVMVPHSHVDAVKSAVFAAGAGAIGDYEHCAFQWEGQGQFRALAGANPTLGQVGQLHHEPECRVEFVAAARRRQAIAEALVAAHPYEEPAFDVVAMDLPQDLETATGLGRIGTLPEPMTFAAFTQQVANALPATEWGVRAAGDPQRLVYTVAVSSGSGDSFLETVSRLDVDVYVTSDLRHHPVDEHLRAGGPAIIDTAHWASEFPWCAQAADIVARECAVTCEVIDIRTDPWTVSAHPQK